MNAYPLLRRLVVALIALAMAIPAALPPGAAAAAGQDLPAALAFICGTVPAAGDEQGNGAAGDHASCQSCTGACHGMVLAAADPALPVPPSWEGGFSLAGEHGGAFPAAIRGYAPRAPPLA